MLSNRVDCLHDHPLRAGHAKLNATALYTRIATSTIRNVMSPFGRLSLIEKKKEAHSSSTERDSVNKAGAQFSGIMAQMLAFAP
jgi:hypothetical protein